MAIPWGRLTGVIATGAKDTGATGMGLTVTAPNPPTEATGLMDVRVTPAEAGIKGVQLAMCVAVMGAREAGAAKGLGTICMGAIATAAFVWDTFVWIIDCTERMMALFDIVVIGTIGTFGCGMVTVCGC